MTIVTINEKYRVNIDEYNHTLEQYNEGGFEITFGKGKGNDSKDCQFRFYSNNKCSKSLKNNNNERVKRNSIQ